MFTSQISRWSSKAMLPNVLQTQISKYLTVTLMISVAGGVSLALTRKPCWKGKLSTVDLHVLVS